MLAFETVCASQINADTRIIGRKCSDYEEVPVIFSALLGEQGAKKTPIFKALVFKPLGAMEKEASDVYKKDLAEYERELGRWESADKDTRGDKPTPPKQKRYFTGDHTPEALRELAQDNPNILRFFDELAREANSRGRYTNGKGGEAQQLLESYNGFLPPMDRKGKHYPSCSANQSLLGSIQPDVLSTIMSSADPTGEFSRYNLATLEKKPNLWNGDSETVLDINPLLVDTYKAIGELPAMKFELSPGAYTIFEEYHNQLEMQLLEEVKPALIGQYNKLSGKLLRWAMVYHIIEAVAKGEKPDRVIDKKAMQIAVLRARYQISQVKAVLSRMENTESSKLNRVYQLALRLNQLITPRDVKRAGLAKTTTEAIEFFRQIEKIGYGKVIRTSQTYKLEICQTSTDTRVTKGVRRWQNTTDIFSNGLESSNSASKNDKDVTKVSEASNLYTARNTPERCQGVTTPFSDNEKNSHHNSTVDTVDTVGQVEGDTTGVRRWQNTTDIFSNDLESSNSASKNDKGDKKVSEASNPDTTKNTPERCQGVTTPFSSFKNNQPSATSIDDFKIGQKVRIDNGSLVIEIAKIDKIRGFLIDIDDVVFKWQRCKVVGEDSL